MCILKQLSSPDLNECETIGRCSQTCVNTEGSYKCSCASGYVLLPNGKNCIPSLGKYFVCATLYLPHVLCSNGCVLLPPGREKLIVAVGVDVRSVSHDGSRVKCLKNTKNVVAVAIHHKSNVMFWADEFERKIFSSLLGRKDNLATIVAIGSFFKDLEIDWVTRKLYWLTTSVQGTATVGIIKIIQTQVLAVILCTYSITFFISFDCCITLCNL